MEKTASTLSVVVKALAFAANKHRDQRRKSARALPYINHPIMLVNVLVNEGGIVDPVVLCAATLHDTVEDTDTTADELQVIFGSKVTSVVLEVSDDKTLPKDVQKQRQIDNATRISKEAKLVELADKICNLRDLLIMPIAGWSIQRQQAYFDHAEKVIAGLRGTHPKLEAVFDEVLLRRPQLRTNS